MNAIADSSTPRLAGKVRLKWDGVREKHLLLYPEGVLVLNGSAHDVLALCDGERTIGEIVKILGEQYGSGEIEGDVKDILGSLAQRTFVTLDD